jgi:translation initiation factor RLI1
LKPNLGRFDDPPDWQAVLKHFRGSELQGYFTKVLEDNLQVRLFRPHANDRQLPNLNTLMQSLD